MTDSPLCTIVGFGPGNGLGLARVFGAAGYRLALISRSPEKQAGALQALVAEGITARAFSADVSNFPALTSTLRAVQESLGVSTVMIYNPLARNFGPPTSLTPEGLVSDFLVNVVGAFVASMAVLPGMEARGHGTIIFTNNAWAIQPWTGAASASLGKAALRNLAFSLADELKETGVRVGSVAIMGQIAAGTPFDPEKNGRAFLAYARRPDSEFTPEFIFEGEP